MGSITGSSLGIEAIGEFQTLTNAYSAQFRGNGAVINAVSKSGTNDFHGSAYDFLRNSALDAREAFDPATIPAFRRNQFGGSVGGPVKKDKAFFFVTYEGIQQLLGESKVAFVPDAAHRTPTSTNPLQDEYIADTMALYPLPAPGTDNRLRGLASPPRWRVKRPMRIMFWGGSTTRFLRTTRCSRASFPTEPTCLNPSAVQICLCGRNLAADKGVCSYDTTHTFRASALYALPFHGNRFVEGWQLTGIVTANTGLPFNISDGIDEVGYTGSGTPRPNCVSGCHVQVDRVNEWFNPACFALETAGTFGDTGRNTGRGPNFETVDLAVLKDTRITERLRAQLRAEFFNIGNHQNLGLPASAVFTTSGVNPSAGVITNIVGTARQIQFALKLVF